MTVTNVAPTVAFTAGPVTVNEGATEYLYSYSISDPGTDTVSSVAVSCGTGGQLVAGSDSNSDTAGSFKCTFPDGPASPTVTVQATDWTMLRATPRAARSPSPTWPRRSP